MSHMASSLINRPAESYRRTGILFSMCLNLVLVVASIALVWWAAPRRADPAHEGPPPDAI